MFSDARQEEEPVQTPSSTGMFSDARKEEEPSQTPPPSTGMFSDARKEEEPVQTPLSTGMFSDARQEESESTPETSEIDDDDTDTDTDDEEEDDEEILTDKKDKLRYKIDLYNNCNKLRDNLKNNIITIDQFKNNIFDKCDTTLGIDVFRNI